MSVEFGIPLSVKDSQYFGNTKITMSEVPETRKAGKTAYHEATHFLVTKKKGKRVLEASVEENKAQGSLGHVVPDQIDAEIAMSAKAMGCDGTGHDEHVADIVGNATAGETGARTLLTGEDTRLNRIGLELTDKGTVDEYGADEIYDKVTTTKSVLVEVQHEDGTKQVETLEAKNDIITPDHNWYRNQSPFPNPFEQIKLEQPPTHQPNKWRTRPSLYPTHYARQ